MSIRRRRRRLRKGRLAVLVMIIVTLAATIFFLTRCGSSQYEGDVSEPEQYSSEPEYSEEPSPPEEPPESSEPEESVQSYEAQVPVSEPVESTIQVDVNSPAEVQPVVGVPAPANWNLILVNPSHPVSADFVPPLTAIDTRFTRDGERMMFHSNAVEYLNRMIQSARNDGVTLTVISAYRSGARQTTLFNNRVQRFINENGYNYEQAAVAAATRVARPGTSEHQTGLAIDFNSLSENFDQSPEFNWLRNNAARYGFILRYPRDTMHITGIIYEPWHFRFVGAEHAQAITQREIVLEQYFEQRGFDGNVVGR